MFWVRPSSKIYSTVGRGLCSGFALRRRSRSPLNRVVKVTLAVILLSLRIPPLKDCRAAYTLAGARAASLLPDGGIILMSPVVCFRKDYGLWWGKTLSHGSPFVDDTECRGYSSGPPWRRGYLQYPGSVVPVDEGVRTRLGSDFWVSHCDSSVWGSGR